MSPITANHPSSAGGRARRSTVKSNLTPNRRRRPAENDEYAPFIRRVLRATPAGSRPVTLTPWPT